MSRFREVYVVPNFISEGYFTQTVIPRELELSGDVTKRTSGQVWKYCHSGGKSPRNDGSSLAKRAQSVAPGIPMEETTLLIVGHGTSLNDQSAAAAKIQAQRLSTHPETRYAAVLSTYMEETPLISDWVTLTSTTVRRSSSFFSSQTAFIASQDIPVLLGIESEPSCSSKPTRSLPKITLTLPKAARFTTPAPSARMQGLRTFY